jgi:hypothetical protein
MAGPGGKLGLDSIRILAVQFGKRALNRKRGAHRAFRVILLRHRIAEHSHQAVTELLGSPPISVTAAAAASR